MPIAARCRSCGASLARHRAGELCATCGRRAHAALDTPPEVPPEFWDAAPLASALVRQHMGEVCRAYRHHPFHTPLHGAAGIPQAAVGHWLGITQAQVSRIENGPPTRNLDALVWWATTLRIPEAHLWFDMPRDPIDERAAPVPPIEPDPTVVASQHDWRRVRRYLNGRRSDLAKAAARLYPEETRLGGAALLTCPAWMPARPIELGNVVLYWTDEPPVALIDGTEPEARAQCPLRIPVHRFARYTAAIRYVDSPTLFENRPSFRLLDARWNTAGGRLQFGLSTYFDKLATAEALGHEVAGAALQGSIDDLRWSDLPYRRIVDPFDLAGRHVVPAITTLTLRRDRRPGAATFLLHWRDPARVATAGGIYDVIPAGEFQPSGIVPGSRAADLDLWRNMVREYSEELRGDPEHDGSQGTALDYERWPFYRAMTRARAAGRLTAYCLGIGVDALTLAATIPTVVVIDGDAFDELLGDVVDVNAEGVMVRSIDGEASATGVAFTETNIRRLLDDEPIAPPGAACLELAWQHRDLLLNRS
jgi:hypothetical protein